MILFFSWFMGDLNSDEVQEMMNGKPPGTFLIRFSSSGSLALSFLNDKGVLMHVLVSFSNGMYLVTGTQNSFPSMKEMVDFYRNSKIFTSPVITLLIPAYNQEDEKRKAILDSMKVRAEQEFRAQMEEKLRKNQVFKHQMRENQRKESFQGNVQEYVVTRITELIDITMDLRKQLEQIVSFSKDIVEISRKIRDASQVMKKKKKRRQDLFFF